MEDYQEREDSRRVVVKGFPENIPQEHLFSFFEQAFGTVRRLFQYRNPANKNRSSWVLETSFSYSVEFESPESASQASAAKQIVLPGLEYPIIIEGFKRRKDATYIKDRHEERLIRFPVCNSNMFCESTEPRSSPTHPRSTQGPSRSHKGAIHQVAAVGQHLHKPTSTAYHSRRVWSRDQEDPSSSFYGGLLRFNIAVKFS